MGPCQDKVPCDGFPISDQYDLNELLTSTVLQSRQRIGGSPSYIKLKTWKSGTQLLQGRGEYANFAFPGEYAAFQAMMPLEILADNIELESRFAWQ